MQVVSTIIWICELKSKKETANLLADKVNKSGGRGSVKDLKVARIDSDVCNRFHSHFDQRSVVASIELSRRQNQLRFQVFHLVRQAESSVEEDDKNCHGVQANRCENGGNYRVS